MREDLEALLLVVIVIIIAFLMVWVCMLMAGAQSADHNVEPNKMVEPPTVDCSGLKHPKQYEMLYTEEEVVACAKLIYGEYGADWVTDTEKAKVVCTLVNRTHSGKWISYVGSSDLMAQLTAPNQFYYLSCFPCTDRHYRIAYDVLWRASQIAQGCEGIRWETDALRYWGDGWKNYFY